MPGQITLETAFGKALRELAADPASGKIFVEIGTWDGEGSTKCLVEGLEARGDLSGAGIFSFEANRDLWMVASRYWQDKNPPLRALWGRLAERMMSEEKVKAHPLFEKAKEHFDLYFQSDLQNFLKAPLVRMRRADVVVLDGGEFCGEGDWDAVRSLKPKFVCLDDINVMKNNDLYTLLFIKTGWLPRFITSERNGAAILQSPGDDDKFYPALTRAWRPEEISVSTTGENGCASASG